MRVEPENGIITLMRGDTLILPIYINIGTKLCPKYRALRNTERLYFGLMEPNQAFEDAVIKKVLDFTYDTDADGNTLLRLNPSDTEKLLVGKYYYTVKLRSIDDFGQEVVKTIVPPTLFWLMGNNVEPEEDVYYKKGKYNIENVVFEGGEITGPEDTDMGNNNGPTYERGEII